jgi:hypothetical protein
MGCLLCVSESVGYNVVLAELFSQPASWSWNDEEDYAPGEYQAGFSVGGSNYYISFLEYDMGGEYPTYSVEFGRKPDSRSNSRHGITNTGHAPVIFATVLDSIAKFIKSREPNMNLFFSADEESRISLYRAIIRRLGLSKVTTERGSLTTVEFTVRIRRKQ